MNKSDQDFSERRQAARKRLENLESETDLQLSERGSFFEHVYETAGDDEAAIPWADLEPKDKLLQWLASNKGINKSAIDVACGLGDNAQAISEANYQTTAFDFAERAINWARKRFPDSPVDYQVADLFNLPKAWIGAFDLVNECYTLQSMPPENLGDVAEAIASLVKPGGKLLIYTRTRPDGTEANGPPWPLLEADAMVYSRMGFELVGSQYFDIHRSDRVIPHLFCEWQRLA